MDVTPEIRLRRFLHYGSEKNVYEPGDRMHMKAYDRFKVTCITDLLEEHQDIVIVETIKKVLEEKSSLYHEAVLFILVHCLFEKKATPPFKTEIYHLAEKATQAPEYLMTFAHFLKWHSNPCKFKTGRGVKRLISNWYLSSTRSPLELAEIVTLTPTHRGFTHRDLIRLAHVSSKDPARDAVLLYSLVGLKKAEEKYGDNPEVERVLGYLKEVDGFRKSTDTELVARKIESYSLTVRHVNSSLLKKKEIWIPLLRQISINDLLDYFQLISRNKLFRNSRNWDTELVRTACDTMGNPASVKDSQVHPSRVFLELYKYKNLPRLKMQMFVRKHRLGTLHASRFPQINSDINSSLSKLLRASFKNLSPMKKRLLIAVEGSEHMKESRCGHSIYTTPLYAAAFITQVFAKVGQKVDVVLSNPLGFYDQFNKSVHSFESIVTEFSEAQKGFVDLVKLIQHAKSKSKKVDAFIILGSYVRLPSYNVITEELKKYDDASKISNTKLVVCSLRGHSSKKAAPSDHPRALLVNGFDDKVCSVIQNFVMGYF